jgi:hypothetical protein
MTHSVGMARRADRLRRDVALILIRTQEGAPLPPIRSLASRFGSSVGATQMAMARLVDEGVVQIDSRPGRGAILLHKNVGGLFAAIQQGPLLVALPLPSTERINGLATAIKSSLTSRGVEAYMVFIRGSRHRIAALSQERCQIAVVSRLAARELTGPAFDLLLTLQAGSFVFEHRVFYVREAPISGRRLRVAIDPSSRDFERLTELEFADVDVELVPLNYLRSVRAMADGTIDAAILDSEDALMHFPPGLAHRSLSERVRTELAGANLEAAFVGRAGNEVVREIVATCFVPAEIQRIQDDVIAGRRPPEY